MAFHQPNLSEFVTQILKKKNYSNCKRVRCLLLHKRLSPLQTVGRLISLKQALAWFTRGRHSTALQCNGSLTVLGKCQTSYHLKREGTQIATIFGERRYSGSFDLPSDFTPLSTNDKLQDQMVKMVSEVMRIRKPTNISPAEYETEI